MAATQARPTYHEPQQFILATMIMVTELLRSTSRTKEADTDEIASHVLRTLTEALLDAMNTLPDRQSEDFLYKYMTPEWFLINEEGRSCALPAVESREKFIDSIKTLRKGYPDWTLEPGIVSATVLREASQGLTHYVGRSRGAPASWNPNHEIVGSFYWEKRVDDGHWQCFKHLGIRGGGDIS